MATKGLVYRKIIRKSEERRRKRKMRDFQSILQPITWPAKTGDLA